MVPVRPGSQGRGGCRDGKEDERNEKTRGRVPDPVPAAGAMGPKLRRVSRLGFLTRTVWEQRHEMKGVGGIHEVTVIAFYEANETRLKRASDAKLEPEVTYGNGCQ